MNQVNQNNLHRLALLLLLVFVSFSQAKAQFDYRPADFYFQISRTARSFTSDSILNIVKSTNTDLNNNFIVRDTLHYELIRALGKINDVLIFDEQGYKFRLHDERRCVNNQLFLKSLSLGLVDTSKHLNYFMSFLQPISASSLPSGNITAIIFWNFLMGVRADDVPFEWEKMLKAKFGDKINVLKVNMDINESWPEGYKKTELARMQRFLDISNSSFK